MSNIFPKRDFPYKKYKWSDKDCCGGERDRMELGYSRIAIELPLRWDEPTGDVWGKEGQLAVELVLRWDKPTRGVDPCRFTGR